MRSRFWRRRDGSPAIPDPWAQTTNPLAALLEDHLRAAQQKLALLERHPAGIRAWPAQVRYWIARHRWDVVLHAVPIAFLVAGGAVLATSHPWSRAGSDHSAVVLAAATVLGLGTILVSSATLPLARILEYGPGNTSALLDRPSIWAVGIALVPLEAFLFYLSTIDPDRSAAFASGFIAAGAFGEFIAISRELFRAADGEQLAIRVADSLQRHQRGAIRLAERLARLSLRKAPHREDVIDTVIDSQRQAIVNRTLLQLAAAIRAAMAAGRTHEASLFWLRLSKTFLSFGDSSDGRLGGVSGPMMTIVEVGEPLANQLRVAGDDHGATLVAQTFGVFAQTRWPTGDAVLLRGASRRSLEQISVAGWSDDSSRVPATAVASLGASVAALDADGEALVTFETLVRIALLAHATNKAHIGTTATEQLASVPIVCAAMDIEAYSRLIDYWGSKLDHLGPVLAAKDLSIDPPRDRLFPGRSLRPGATLQHSVVTLAGSLPDHARVVSAEVLDLLERNAHTFLGEAVDDWPMDSPLERALSLELCVLLAVEHACHEDEELAQRGLKTLKRLVGWTPPERRAESLLYEDIAELIWSVLLCCGALGAAIEEVAEMARFVREEIGDVHKDVYFTTFDRSFLLGLVVLSGATANGVAQTRRELEEIEPDYEGWDRIRGLGLAPGVNRNATMHFTNSVDRVEDWARTTFPLLSNDG